MRRQLTPDDCVFCYVVKGLATGCSPKRKADEAGRCSVCGCRLPPKGSFERVKYLAAKDEDGVTVGAGYAALVKKKSDGKEAWFVVHARGGAGSALFECIGMSADRFKKWLATRNLVCDWPTDPVLNNEKLFPTGAPNEVAK